MTGKKIAAEAAQRAAEAARRSEQLDTILFYLFTHSHLSLINCVVIEMNYHE